MKVNGNSGEWLIETENWGRRDGWRWELAFGTERLRTIVCTGLERTKAMAAARARLVKRAMTQKLTTGETR